MKAIKIGIIWANPYSGNLGVAALAYSSLYLLEKISKQKRVKFKYHIIGGPGHVHDVLEIGEYKIPVENVRWGFTGGFKSFASIMLKKTKEFLKINKLDIILDIGAGDSFSDIYGMQKFRAIIENKKLFQLMGKRQVLLPQTIGPFSSKKAIVEGKKAISNAFLVLARDKQSFDYVNELVPEKKVYELIDVAFFMPYQLSNVSGNKVRIGINISGLLWNGGYTKDNQFNLKTDYRELMHMIIRHFLADDNNEVYIIAHVISPNYQKLENDLRACDEVKELYPATHIAPAFKNPIEAKSFISGLDFFTGARMHACIGAFSSGVPVYPLAYSRKFNGLFGDTLKYVHYGDLIAFDTVDVFNGMVSAFNNRSELKSVIKSRENFLLERESQLLGLLSDAILEKGN